MALAEKDYKLGDVIIDYEEPYAFDIHREGHCAVCGISLVNSAAPRACDECQRDRYCGMCYCSDECELKNKSCHQMGSRYFENAAERSLDVRSEYRLFNKLVCLQLAPQLDESKSSAFEKLLSHADEIKVKNAAYYKKFKSMTHTSFSPWLLKIFGKMIMNSVSIFVDGKSIGSGIYLQAARCVHSCRPNSARVFEGLKLKVVALQDIPAGEKITTASIDPFNPTNYRKKVLKREFYLDCECELCTDLDLIRQQNAFRCANQRCTGDLLETRNVFQCDECKSKPSARYLEKCQNIQKKFDKTLVDCQDENEFQVQERSTNNAFKRLQEYRKSLSANNIRLHWLKYQIYLVHSESMREEKRWELEQELDDVYERFYPKHYLPIGLLKYRKAELDRRCRDDQKYLSSLQKALELLEPIMGTDHSFITKIKNEEEEQLSRAEQRS